MNLSKNDIRLKCCVSVTYIVAWELATFAENKLRSANRKSPFFALACIIFGRK
nr:MAG TPA: hypothetical protein [Caudoviricetes sp.]